MKQERLKILDMLDAGKINATEATTLLEALNAADENGFEEASENVQDKLQRAAKCTESAARNFGQKVKEAYKDVEPKLKKAGQVVLEKTTAVVDNLSKSLHDAIEKRTECCDNPDCECDPCECGDDCECTEDNNNQNA
jgi:polyhydroxyalkanoate synthesis regulator phasin